ncbi:MAG: GBS Bsp-like repeat-containing protein, partial [Christensenellaceae bacterium]
YNNGCWGTVVDIANHGNHVGNYQIHVYGTDNSGNRVIIGHAIYKVEGDGKAPVCDGIDVTKFNADGSQFHTGALNVRDMSGVSKVEFAIWSDASGGADVKWYNGNNYNNGCWGTVVDIANHGNHIGNYQIHVYGTDGRGNRDVIGYALYKVEGDSKAPVCDGIDATKFNAAGTQFHIGALNVRDMSGVSKVEFAVWSDASGGADIKWYNGNNYNNGSWGAVVDVANHGRRTGKYQIHAYGTDGKGNRDLMGYVVYTADFDTSPPKMSSIAVSQYDAAGRYAQITLSGVTDPSGVAATRVAVWSNASGGADLKWMNLTSWGNDTWGGLLDTKEFGFADGTYNVHAYGTDGYGNDGLMGTGAFYVTPTEITYSTITVESWAYFDGIVINDPWCNYGISEMYMYVTSAATGPNNGIYYDMKNNGDFFWAGNVYFNDVRGYTYHIDVVLVDKRGAHHLVESADVK